MASHDELRDSIWQAWQAEPKPLGRERAMEIVRQVLAPTAPGLIAEFATWFDKHGDRALEKLHE